MVFHWKFDISVQKSDLCKKNCKRNRSIHWCGPTSGAATTDLHSKPSKTHFQWIHWEFIENTNLEIPICDAHNVVACLRMVNVKYFKYFHHLGTAQRLIFDFLMNSISNESFKIGDLEGKTWSPLVAAANLDEYHPMQWFGAWNGLRRHVLQILLSKMFKFHREFAKSYSQEVRDTKCHSYFDSTS